MKEIERKFKITQAAFDKYIVPKAYRSTDIRQYYLMDIFKRTLRLRVTAKSYIITFKGRSSEDGLSRTEIEAYLQKPLGRLLELVASLFRCKSIAKTRHLIFVGGHTWEVDIFLGKNCGLLLAEVELQSIDEKPILPVWADNEVTGNPKYYNSYLAK